MSEREYASDEERKAAESEDVEGHSFQSDDERKAAESEDVEGHSFKSDEMIKDDAASAD